MKLTSHNDDIIYKGGSACLEIHKTDFIKVLFGGDKNWVIDIKDKEKDIDVRIKFEDSETLEYFYEKLHKEIVKTRPTIRSRMESLRLKSIEINKEMNKIAVRTGYQR